MADSVRSAADSLDERVPQLAQLARGTADRIEDFSESIRDQSAAELFQSAADFARRRPSVLFGATAAIGFLLYRLATVAPVQDYDTFEEVDWEDWEGEDDQPGDDFPSGARTAGQRGQGGGGQFGGA
jgi:hypothetical protein